MQNTGQNLAMAAIPPVFGALVTVGGFPAAYLVTAAVAAMAVPLVPADPKAHRENGSAAGVRPRAGRRDPR
ncbi:sugar transporter family protein [Mycobacteroides abscessus subsp. abscessus]|nr:sugar transporter family protein [Mycobacteroides abscessus subsp. abscessus]